MNKKVVVSNFGGPEVLALRALDMPQPQPDEIIIKTAYAGVGAIDAIMRRGALKKINLQPPFTPGIEVSGWVEAIGSEVTDFEPGQTVASIMMPDGGYASYVRAKASLCTALPSEDLLQAAASIVNVTTAYLLVTQCVKIQPQTTALVHGVSGGLGSAAVQILRMLEPNIKITATVRDSTKQHYAKKIGCDLVMNSDDFLRITDAAAQYNLVIDPVGGDSRRKSIELLEPGGTLLAVGNVTSDFDSNISSQELWLGGKTISGFNLALFASLHSDTVQQSIQYVVNALNDQKLAATPAQVFAFEDVQNVHKLLENGILTGRAILRFNHK